MVPARSDVLRHDSRRRSRSCYPQYCVAAQPATPAAAVPARSSDCLRPPPRVLPRRVAMAPDDDDEAQRRRQGEEAAAVPSSSSWGGGGIDDGKDWLQLGLATASSSSTSSSSPVGDSDSTAPALATPMAMDLFADKHSTRVMRPPLPIRTSYHYQYGHDRYGPTTASGSMPAPFLSFPRPLRSFPGDLTMRVIIPPPRTSAEVAGLWLTLHAARNQVGEPILPQIPKSYLRIKDINMKVELVMKYLSDKLGLPQSHQLELTCRGQLLPPFLLLKYVRDAIWCSPAAATATDHVMTLFYSTSRNHPSL